MSQDPKPSPATDESVDTPPAASPAGVITVTADGTASVPETAAVDHVQAASEPPPTDAADASAARDTGKAMSESHSQTPSSAAPAPVAPVVIKQSSGKGLAFGALVLSLLALGGSGFLFVQGQNVLKTQELAFEQKIQAAGLGEGQNALLLERHSARMAEIDGQLQTLHTLQQQQAADLDSTARAYRELVKSRADWLVDETEATLNLAAQQLLINGNVPLAVSVLENLESRLARFEQPALVPVKQALSSDLAALRNRPYVDVTSASLRLNRLETAVDSLPLALDSALQPGAAPAVVPPDAQAPWWQRAWDSIVNSLRGMVEVRQLDNRDAMLMSPEQVFFVRENLRLRVMDARLALMQRNGEVYLGDLNSSEAAVKQYFDTASPATQAWLKELAQLKSVELQPVQDRNVLSASLAAVRQYQQQAQTEPARLSEASAPADDAASAPAASAPAASAPAAPAAASAAGGRTL